MSSFTTVPILKMYGKRRWELFTPYTYYRDPVYRSDGTIKPPEEYSEREKRLFTSGDIVVPAGFITDLASIPSIFWSMFPPHDEYAKAAILHDYLYETGMVTREEADYIFYEAMGVLDVSKWKRQIIYRAVRLFGGSSYKGYKGKP